MTKNTIFDVCLVSPAHLAFNPRLCKEAQALVGSGYSVAICCGDYSDWGWEADKKLANPRWNVRHVAYGPFRACRLDYFRQTATRQAARALKRVGAQSAAIVEASAHSCSRDLLAAALKTPARLYIAHNLAALPAAARAAAAHGGRYAFDAEDFHLGVEPDSPERARERQTIRLIEARYLAGTALVTAASPLIADKYAETYGIVRPHVVLNVFPRASAPIAPTKRGQASPGPSFYWFSQTIGPGRGIETAIKAIALAKSTPHLYLRGAPASEYGDKLCLLGHAEGISERLHFLDPAAPDELERLGSEFDIGYSGEAGFSLNNTVALGNKLFSYLSSGLALISSDIAAHRAIADEFGPALALFKGGDAHALACELDRFLLDPALLAQAREHSWRLGQSRFCWEFEQREWLAHIERVLSDGFADHRAGSEENVARADV